jgi:hypothetical protein
MEKKAKQTHSTPQFDFRGFVQPNLNPVGWMSIKNHSENIRNHNLFPPNHLTA